jgi:mannose-6-phosphate isomerase-like protein (cupin superfamily)
MTKGNLHEKAKLIHNHWQPQIIGELNGQQVKLAKIKGKFVWHKHDNEDELFLVVSGQFKMELRDQTLDIKENDYIIIPKGVEHRPVAEHEATILLFEPAGTLNTGNVEHALTYTNLKKI